jgi:hypothetical protein
MRIAYALPILFGALLSASAYADHDNECVGDYWDAGDKIEIKSPFPGKWLTIDGRSFLDPQFHADLKAQFPDRYVSGFDEEHFQLDAFCAQVNGTYIQIRNTDFGPVISYYAEAPKCSACQPISTSRKFKSPLGLTIGQDKSAVSRIVGHNIQPDLATIVFNETSVQGNSTTWHSQYLHLEFRAGLLYRYSVSDSTEHSN